MQTEATITKPQDLWEAFLSASIFAQVAAGSFVLGKFFGIIAIMSVLSGVMALPTITIYGLLIATSIVCGLADVILAARGE